MKKLNQLGFSHVEALIVLIVVALIGAVGFYVFNRSQNSSSNAETKDNSAVLSEAVNVPAAQLKALADKLGDEARRDDAGQVVSEGNNCSNGAGTSGARVQLLYLTGEANNTFGSDFARVRQDAQGVNVIFNESAAKTGGKRKVRWARNDKCLIAVEQVKVKDSVFRGLAKNQRAEDIIAVLKEKGFNKADRKYLAVVNATATSGCGPRMLARNDDSPDSSNRNNNTSYQFLFRPCWDNQNDPGANAVHMASVLAESLGAPQSSAPHAQFTSRVKNGREVRSFTNSLYDMNGILSADTQGGVNATTYTCPEEQAYLLDCNNDDYYNAAPTKRTYVRDNWNIYFSNYLYTPSN